MRQDTTGAGSHPSRVIVAYHPFRDMWFKVVSVVLAVLLWVTVTGEPVVERGLEIPLEFENVPVGLEIFGAPPDTLRESEGRRERSGGWRLAWLRRCWT